MKKLLITFAVITFSCTGKIDDPQSIINASISAHNSKLLENHTVSFDFRDRSYSVRRLPSLYTYTRSFQDSVGVVYDVLINSNDFKRTVDDYDVVLTEEWKKRYGNSVNSVLYFFQIPYVLNDPAARKFYLGEVMINGKSYHIIKVTFNEEDGGKDFEDEFRYWINQETKLVDYLAYNYLTDGGGTRFRQAINRREVDGLVVQDYINYKANEKFPLLDDLPRLFEKDSLIELSRIINTNVVLTKN